MDKQPAIATERKGPRAVFVCACGHQVSGSSAEAVAIGTDEHHRYKSQTHEAASCLGRPQ